MILNASKYIIIVLQFYTNFTLLNNALALQYEDNPINFHISIIY